MFHVVRSLAALLLILPLAGLSAALPAAAHPHVSVQMRTTILFEAGNMVGFRHTWVFDEGFVASNLDEFDTDRDGRLSPDELAPLTNISMQSLQELDYFTVVRHGGAKIRVERPADVSMAYIGDLLALNFTVHLARPVPARNTDVQIEIYDPTYFSVLDYAEAGDVTLGEGAASSCTVALSNVISAEQRRAIAQFARDYGKPAAAMVRGRAVVVRCKDAARPASFVTAPPRP